MIGKFPPFLSPVLLACLLLLPVGARAVLPPSESPEYQSRIEADWHQQEKRLGRNPASAEAIHAALKRVQTLKTDLEATGSWHWDAGSVSQLGKIRQQAEKLDVLDASARLDLYRQIRWLGRQMALENPLVKDKPLVFMKRKRFICQMLHEYLGYFYDYGDIAGGGVFSLSRPGRSFETKDLIQGRLPKGNFTTLALSYDGRKIYFAFAERAGKQPDFYSAERRGFHLYEMQADGSGLRQLTGGVEDDFDPCPLPDGTLAFMSSRRGGFGRCHNPWEPLPTYTLHKLNLATGEITRLSYHETNEWHPSVTPDGRIVYTRWDYVDRSAANFHGLWITNPDGTGAMSLFGNYTTRINACYQPRPVPGSRKLVFVAGAHHADVGGSLVMLDPQHAALDAKSGEDAFDSIEVLTPEVCFPEAPGWPASYFHSPWPLSEKYFLVSFSFEPLPGMGPKVDRDTRTGLYYFDRFGNLELLYDDPEISCMYPIPLESRPKPPIIPTVADAGMGDEGEFFLADIQRSLKPLPESRRIIQLRIFQILPKTGSHVANQPRIGHANAENARLLLGTVPVAEDGSAYFRAPARKPLYFQAVDEHGRAVQGMRSAVYLQPGEKRGCVGCHEPQAASPPARLTLSQTRPPSRIEPGPDGSSPMSYMRLVQPIWDRHCTSCHGEKTPKSQPLLTAAPANMFVQSYQNLKPYVRWHEWGGDSISQIATRPGHLGADESPLVRVLEDRTHAASVKLTDAERRAVYLWLDANIPFYGAYLPDEQLAQKNGEAIALPGVQ